MRHSEGKLMLDHPKAAIEPQQDLHMEAAPAEVLMSAIRQSLRTVRLRARD
jgi:uncharacterized membrane protein